MNINLTNVQSKSKVISANETAVNDGNYTVVANATFADPSPIEGKGFRVFVRNGTAIVGGTSYAVAGTQIVRLFHSGSWANYTNITDLSGYVPTSRTINGLDLSVNRTLSASDVGAVATNSAITGATKTKITYDAKGLITGGADATTADIADSTNKRYVTDAQLTVIGNTSGTNTGDETKSSILSKLGFFIYKQPAPNPTVTGSAETIIGSVNIGNNKLSTSDKLIIDSDFVKTNLSTATLRYYLAPNSNNLIGATQIAVGSVIASAIFVPTFPRVFNIENGNLSGFAVGVSVLVPIPTVNSRSSVAFNPSDTRYLITTVTFANASETGYLNSQIIKNF